jgi:AcrR family transcriptional regulator
MNEKFFELPEGKRLRIINAGFEVFSQNDYKKASTEDIAAKAGISKGLLFYYFHNKKALYLFLFDYTEQMLREYVMDTHFFEITDIFDLLAYSTEKKYKIMKINPHIMDFMLRVYRSQKEDVTNDINKKWQNTATDIFSSFFANMDYSKFKADVSPQEIIQMILWMAEGYLGDRLRMGELDDLDDMTEKFRIWTDFFKKASYKEEYLV